MAWQAGVQSRTVSIENNKSYKLAFCTDEKTCFAELHNSVSGARSYTIREVTDHEEKFTYNNGIVTGYIGETPADGILRLPSVQPDGTPVCHVEMNLYWYDDRIKEVVIPDGVQDIYELSGTYIKKVDIPASVDFISSEAFKCDMVLGEINIAPANTKYIFKNNILYYIPDYDPEYKTALFAVRHHEIVLDSDTACIASGFLNDTYYSSGTEDPGYEIPALYVTIPASVEDIEYDAFVSDNLIGVVIEKGKLENIWGDTFVSANLNDITIPKNVEFIDKNALCDNPFAIVHGTPDTVAEVFEKSKDLTFEPIVEEIENDDDNGKYDIANANIDVDIYDDNVCVYNGNFT